MIKPRDDNFTEMSATEFELWVKSLLESSGEQLHGLKILHNEKIQNQDGIYQIDITARFKIFGGEYLLLIECKHHKSPIKREVVQALHDKVHVLGAQKGMLFSTVGFQSGAIQYARQQGIALVRVAEGKSCYETRSADGLHEPPPWANIPKYIGWITQEKENGAVGMSSIAPNRTEYFLDLFNETGVNRI
ncbi:MAG: restriction endonuclease [Smithella sp.]